MAESAAHRPSVAVAGLVGQGRTGRVKADGGRRPLADTRQRLYTDQMIIAWLIFFSLVTCASLIASALAAIIYSSTKSTALSLASGTLVMPILVCASLVYWIKTMSADDPAPGNVLAGSLLFLAVLTPMAFLASRIIVRSLVRRGPRDGN